MESIWGRDRELVWLSAAIGGGRSMVLTGALGIGKSRLLKQVIADWGNDRWVVHVVANQAASTIPFGAVASLLPAIDASDQLALLRAAVDRFVRLADGRQPVVVVDDAHHLDTASTALLYELCVTRAVPLIAAYRIGETLPVAVAELFKEIGAERVELGPLSRRDVSQLASQMLQTEPGDALLDELVTRSEGNPLFVVELLRAYRAQSPDRLTGRLSDLVRARLAALPTEAQTVMEYVAIAEPVLAELNLIDDDALVELERAGLVATEERRDGLVVARSAHPLYGEVVRAGMSQATRRLAARHLTDAMLDTGNRARGDALRLAGWLLDIGDEPDAALCVESAREALAWLETGFARRLIELALRHGLTYRAAYVAGEICRVTGDVDGAKERFGQALELAETDAQIRQVSLSLAFIHAFFDGHARESVIVLEHAVDRVHEPAKRLELGVDQALFWALLGEYAHVMAAARDAIADPACDGRTEWTALLHSLWAEAQTAQLTDSFEHLERALSYVGDSAIATPGGVDLVHMLDATVHIEKGLLREAVERATGWIESAPSMGVPCGITHFIVATAQWSMGDIPRARAMCDRALTQLASFDWFNTTPLAISQAVILAIADGDRRAADRLYARAQDAAFDATPFGAIWRWRTEAWLAGWSQPQEAVKRFVESARCAFDKAQGLWGLTALHESLLFGGAKSVVGELDRLEWEPVDGAYVELLIEHIRARAAENHDWILRCAERFDAMEARWQAVDAWHAAARLSPTAVERARASTRAVMLGLPSALGAGTQDVARHSLSPRQIEIARRAAAGTTSRAIASEMYLSIRTVDNHLRNIYRALDVDGRAALTDVLGDPVRQPERAGLRRSR